MFTLNLLCGLICRVDFQVVAMHICVCCVIRAACLAVIEMPLRGPVLNPRRVGGGIPLILGILTSLWQAKCGLCEASAPRGEKHTFTVRWSYSTWLHTHACRMRTRRKVSLGVLICFYIDLHSFEWVRKSVSVWGVLIYVHVCVNCMCMYVETWSRWVSCQVDLCVNLCESWFCQGNTAQQYRFFSVGSVRPLAQIMCPVNIFTDAAKKKKIFFL